MIPLAVIPKAPPKPRLTWNDFGVALSIANILFIRVWWEVLTYTPADTMIMKYSPPPSYYAAVVLNVIIVASVLAFGTFLVRKYVTRPFARIVIDVILSLVFVGFAVSLLYAVSGRYPGIREAAVRTFTLRGAIVVAIVTLGAISYLLFRRRTVRAAIVLLPFVPLTFGQAAWKAINWNPAPFSDKPLASVLPVPAGGQRVLWFIFDRMDQRLTFIDRPSYVALPEFDRLRREAVYASNAFPPAAYTILSMPALMEGRLVNSVSHGNTDTLWIRYHNPQQRRPRWDSSTTVFADARKAGFNSGLIGYYLPYCRILNDNLSQCEWFDIARQHNSYYIGSGIPGPAEVPGIMLNQARSVFETHLISPFGQSLPTQKHAYEYQKVLESARTMAVDRRLSLTLLHVPIPHWPYFYNSRTGSYDRKNSLVSGYFDSLILADRMFGILRRDLEAAGLWDDTVILVSSDHSHRAGARQIDGKSDPRVPFLLKMAGQKTGSEFPPEFNTVLTKDLLLAILKREVGTPEEAMEWLRRHRSFSRSPYDDDL